MDADARGRALELRVAELEERLRRLELAQGHPAGAPVPAPQAVNTAAAFTAPSTPVAAAPPPPPPPTTFAPAPSGAATNPRWQVREPRVRVSLADLEARLTGRALAW